MTPPNQSQHATAQSDNLRQADQKISHFSPLKKITIKWNNGLSNDSLHPHSTTAHTSQYTWWQDHPLVSILIRLLNQRLFILQLQYLSTEWKKSNSSLKQMLYWVWSKSWAQHTSNMVPARSWGRPSFTHFYNWILADIDLVLHHKATWQVEVVTLTVMIGYLLISLEKNNCVDDAAMWDTDLK